MNHSIILLLSLALIAGMLSPAYAQTISNNVVINEVDTNPYGDDSAGPFEWIEIYNPTNSDVDLSGWQIASTTVLKKTSTISDGTIISPGEFLIFTYQKVWFTDSNESVELRNIDGIIIDKTPSVTDLQNNFLSWQRIYDGYSDWEFALATAGGSNGKLVEISESSPVVVIVSSDKSSYLFDETAIIQGTVSKKVYIEKPYFQTEPILINISGSNYYQSVSLYPDTNLNYEMTLSLVQVLGIDEGVYHVSVTYAGVTTDTSFSVGHEIIQREQDQTDATFSIQTEESEYFSGELVTFTGSTSEIIPFESLQFTITDPNDKQIASGNLFTTDGEFGTVIPLPSVHIIYGTYTITAQYFEQTSSTTFSIVEEIVEEIIPVSNSITFILDDSEYLFGDNFNLSGIISNFDSNSDIYYQVVNFNFKSSDGTIPTFTTAIMENTEGAFQKEFTLTAIPDASGAFSIDTQLPPVTFTLGDYTIQAKYGILTESKLFSIVSEKSIPVSHVRTIIEKTNRISDDLISINTQEKIIEEQSVKPRVLSGSMMTMSKDAQSNVNLRVVSDSGICIIGQSDECLVSDSTRKPGQIFDVVEVDGLNLNVRYTGPDVRLEKFSILPESSTEFLPDTNWNVEVIKDDEISRFYYKITYKTLE
jgi:hypothetical protein